MTIKLTNTRDRFLLALAGVLLLGILIGAFASRADATGDHSGACDATSNGGGPADCPTDGPTDGPTDEPTDEPTPTPCTDATAPGCGPTDNPSPTVVPEPVPTPTVIPRDPPQPAISKHPTRQRQVTKCGQVWKVVYQRHDGNKWATTRTVYRNIDMTQCSPTAAPIIELG